jgi:hypothetical protein
MSCSTGTGGVVGECACWAAEVVVEADRCGEGEEAAADAGAEAVQSPCAVVFEGEEVFAGLEDRFDPLSDRCQVGPVACEAAAYRRNTHGGEAIGRIVISRLGLDMIFVDGTDHDLLTKGPGRDERTYMPGQNRLVYIAGHRTTYLAPFSHIDDIRPGDAIKLELPYATFVYRAVRHEIVPPPISPCSARRGTSSSASRRAIRVSSPRSATSSMPAS